MTTHAAPLREALYELSMAKDVPDAETLDGIIRLYPQYAKELVDFAVEIAIDSFKDEDTYDLSNNDIEEISPAVSRAMSHYQNRLFEQNREKAAKPAERIERKSAENPFANLDRKSLREFSKRIHANPTFVIRLRDRQIQPNTIPASFTQCISQELGVPPEVMLSHFQAEQRIVSGQFFKSDSKPATQEQWTFEYAVKNSGLTEEQQNYILQI